MDRPVRVKKTVDYSLFGDVDNDDEDFACSSAPPNKKSRVEVRKDKKEKSAKKPRKEGTTSQPNSQGKRLPLDDKLYHRDLEVALALSVQEKSLVGTSDDQFSKGSPTLPDGSTRSADVSFSNCSVDSSTLGLDAITCSNEDQADGRNRRQAASKAIAEQRKLLADDSDNEDAGDEFKPDLATYSSSESDSNLSEEDEEFDIKMSSKLKANKETKQKCAKKSPKERKLVPKPRAAVSSTSPPVSVKIKSLPAQRTALSSPTPVKQTQHHSSPPVGVKKQKWTPPAASVQGNGVKNSLEGVSVRSPNQGLRLGLSRFARVKPLHPTIVNN
ncbi:RAD51-associated protein 1 isoform X1 [Pelobates fuscus]|uniref:RAD51-associated protein 1 isoform X1 n=1 Tax=Pelobates fuscus TaxID=191477 RepID=UPI002FE43E84